MSEFANFFMILIDQLITGCQGQIQDAHDITSNKNILSLHKLKCHSLPSEYVRNERQLYICMWNSRKTNHFVWNSCRIHRNLAWKCSCEYHHYYSFHMNSSQLCIHEHRVSRIHRYRFCDPNITHNASTCNPPPPLQSN